MKISLQKQLEDMKATNQASHLKRLAEEKAKIEARKNTGLGM